MWLMTRHGFFSIAAAKSKSGEVCSDLFQVRGRVRGDLENLIDAAQLHSVTIHATPTNDYAFRILVNSADLIAIQMALIASLDYTNFKDCVAATPDQKDRHGLYHRVWGIMNELKTRVKGAHLGGNGGDKGGDRGWDDNDAFAVALRYGNNGVARSKAKKGPVKRA